MMYGHEKSDLAIVAVKPANKAERSATELVERRAGTKGNAGQLSTRWAQSQISVTQDVGSTTASTCRRYPRWEPYAGKPHVRLCGGARGNSRPYREQTICCICSGPLLAHISHSLMNGHVRSWWK